MPARVHPGGAGPAALERPDAAPDSPFPCRVLEKLPPFFGLFGELTVKKREGGRAHEPFRDGAGGNADSALDTALEPSVPRDPGGKPGAGVPLALAGVAPGGRQFPEEGRKRSTAISPIRAIFRRGSMVSFSVPRACTFVVQARRSFPLMRQAQVPQDP